MNLVSGTKSILETDGLCVVYTLSSIWKSGHSLGVEVKNISEETVSEWAARIPIKEEIASILGGETNKRGSVLLSYNQIILNLNKQQSGPFQTEVDTQRILETIEGTGHRMCREI